MRSESLKNECFFWKLQVFRVSFRGVPRCSHRGFLEWGIPKTMGFNTKIIQFSMIWWFPKIGVPPNHTF